MNKNSYSEVRFAVEQWITENKKRFMHQNILIEEIEKTPEQLYLILHFKRCLAAIVVAENFFAPYRYVSFEMGDIIDGVHEMIYSWYDDETTTINEIADKLNKSIEIALIYNNKT